MRCALRKRAGAGRYSFKDVFAVWLDRAEGPTALHDNCGELCNPSCSNPLPPLPPPGAGEASAGPAPDRLGWRDVRDGVVGVGGTGSAAHAVE